MYFSFATAIAALPFLVASAPPKHPDDIGLGTAVPLSKHSTMIDSNGTANISAMRAHLAQIKAKFQHGFDTYEANTGKIHPLAPINSLEKRGEGGNPLIPYGAQLWYGDISVGVPPSTYTVDFDTGSSDLFLPGPHCDSSCENHQIYDPSASSASSDLGQTFNLQYGDNSTVSGEQYSDQVTIAGLIAKPQTLGVAYQYSPGFQISRFPADGLMGMAFESLSVYGAPPVFQNLISTGQINSPVFGVKLADDGSELYLGGVNRQLYKGEFTYVNVDQAAYWQVPMDAVTVSGQDVTGSVQTIIDTGTTLIVADDYTVEQFYNHIDGQPFGQGFYSVPCNGIPTIGLVFGGTSFAISPETFKFATDPNDSTRCIGGLVSMEQDLGFWIIGDVFLRNVYTSFDVGGLRVGFAKLA